MTTALIDELIRDEDKPNHFASSTDSLEFLIDNERWDEAYIRFQENPEAAKRVVDPSSKLGWTYLHWLCATPGTPDTLIDLVASLHPSAIVMPDNRYRDTPLHLVCRNSLTSSEKVHILLKYCPKVDEAVSTNSQEVKCASVLTRNVFGGTALHSASNHNALLETLHLLVDANPSILKVRTIEGIHAVSALWMSYMQTIPGTMAVARILKCRENDINSSSLFAKFWKKVEFLSTEYFFYTQSNNSYFNNLDAATRRNYVLHGLIRCDVPITLYFLALKINPDSARAVDADGNLPLHLLVENRPYRLKEKEAIVATVQVAPETAGVQNLQGEVPLIIGIRNKIPWENGLGEIVAARTDVACQKDACTGLYPFQFAAQHGGRVAVETTFHLLCTRPDLLSS